MCAVMDDRIKALQDDLESAVKGKGLKPEDFQSILKETLDKHFPEEVEDDTD